MASRTLEGGRPAPNAARRHRYTRASTASVTQLLSDSCTSLLHRLTRRVPSEKPTLSTFSPSTPTGKSRYEDLKLLKEKKDSVLNSVQRYETDRKYEERPNFYSSVSDRLTRVDELAPLLPFASSSKNRFEAASASASAKIRSRTEDVRPTLSSFSTTPSRPRPSPPVLSASRQPLKEADTNHNHKVSKERQGSPALGSTRSRLEDKYSAVLDKVAHRKKEKEKKENEDRERTIEPSLPRSIVRSLTTAVFGEKSYPYLGSAAPRDKTPFKCGGSGERRTSSVRRKLRHEDMVAPSRGKDRDSIYRSHGGRSVRAGKSDTSDRFRHMRLCDVDIGEGSSMSSSSSLSSGLHRQQLAYHDDDESTPTADPALLERETKRKEIQSLIMKYSALDEVYGRAVAPPPPPQKPPPPPPSHMQALALAPGQKPAPKLAPNPAPRGKHINACTPPVSGHPLLNLRNKSVTSSAVLTSSLSFSDVFK